MKQLITRRAAGKLGLAALAAPAFSTTVLGQAAPIKIGSSMAMTGGLGPNGKSSLLAIKIWEEDINARGGLLGRKVQVIFRASRADLPFGPRPPVIAMLEPILIGGPNWAAAPAAARHTTARNARLQADVEKSFGFLRV